MLEYFMELMRFINTYPRKPEDCILPRKAKDIEGLGGGAFSKVVYIDAFDVPCYDKTFGDRKDYAIKSFELKKLPGFGNVVFGLNGLVKSGLREIAVFRKINNQQRYIVRYLGCSIITFYYNYRKPTLVLAMEPCRNNAHTLFYSLIPGRCPNPMQLGTVSLGIMMTVMCPILEALAYLHSKGIIHRDVKEQNIILDDSATPKLCDFGISTTSYRLLKQRHVAGTENYIAPEVFKGKVTPKNDIWSWGMSLVSTFNCGKETYGLEKIETVVDALVSGKQLDIFDYLAMPPQLGYHELIKKEDYHVFCSFLRKVLVIDYRARLTAKELMKDPFVCGIIEDWDRHMNGQETSLEFRDMFQIIQRSNI